MKRLLALLMLLLLPASALGRAARMLVKDVKKFLIKCIERV